MRSSFFGNMGQQQLPGRFVLQNSKMLRVHLNGEVLARQGSMVAFQGRWTSTTRAPAASAGS